MTEPVYIGPETGVRLDDVRPLILPHLPDAGGFERPSLTPETLQLSAELAGATYSLDLENWLNAGWQDLSVEVDELLLSGIRSQDAANPWVQITSSAKLEMLRARIRQRNPIGQAIGALRQLRSSDTVKAVVMLHPAPGGRYVLAISFMGTTERMGDWLSNFRVSSERGWHQGFLQLTEQFEQHERRIVFPQAARALGLERLTLRDILDECAGEESRFRIWLSGHSQGAAVMQIWTARRMAEGLNPVFLMGCGLASPSVCRAGAVPDPAAYPLYQVISSDDVVPRMGSQVHLGVCLFRRADEALRSACYAWPRDVRAVRARMAARAVVSRMKDTGRCIEVGIALLRELRASADPGRLRALRRLNPDWPVHRLLEQAGEDTVRAVLNAIIRRGSAACVSITGHLPDEARMAEDAAAIRAALAEIGAEALLGAMTEMGINAHSALAPFGARQGVYPYIATHGLERLVPAVWNRADPPALVRREGLTGQLPAPSVRLRVRPLRAPARSRARGR